MSNEDKDVFQRLRESFEELEDNCWPSLDNRSFQWTAKGMGFGEFYFYYKGGQLMCSNELMGKQFIKDMLCQMVDSCELDCVSERNTKDE